MTIITDQELADAIRQRFPLPSDETFYDADEHEELGYAIRRFCDEHPPPLDIKPGDELHHGGNPGSNVTVVGWNPHPERAADQVIVVFDHGGVPMTVHRSELKPRKGNQ